MYKKWNKMMFIFFTMLSIYLGMSSSSFLGMWMSMEVNLMMFIPIMHSNKSVLETESIIKYFLTQFIGSSLFMYTSLMMCMTETKLIFFLQYLTFWGLIIKMGAAPMHFWLPSVIKGMTWFNVYFMSVFQKLIPLFVFVMFNFSFNLCILGAVSGTLMGSLSGINQVCLRKIMTFSSISHLGWIILITKLSYTIFYLYFLFYSYMMMEVTFLFNNSNMSYLTDLFYKKNTLLLSLMLAMNFFSLAGLPPFLGFFPKLVAIFFFVKIDMTWLVFFMMMMGLISSFFYIRMTLSSLLMSSNSFKFSKDMSSNVMKGFKSIMFMKLFSGMISFFFYFFSWMI